MHAEKRGIPGSNIFWYKSKVGISLNSFNDLAPAFSPKVRPTFSASFKVTGPKPEPIQAPLSPTAP